MVKNNNSNKKGRPSLVKEWIDTAKEIKTGNYVSKDEQNIRQLTALIDELSQDKNIVDFIIDVKNTIRFLAKLELNRLVEIRQTNLRIDNLSTEVTNKQKSTKKNKRKGSRKKDDDDEAER